MQARRVRRDILVKMGVFGGLCGEWGSLSDLRCVQGVEELVNSDFVETCASKQVMLAEHLSPR